MKNKDTLRTTSCYIFYLVRSIVKDILAIESRPNGRK